jgi:RHS repeat-associated protein
LTTKRYEYIYGKGRKLAKVEYEGDVLEAQVYYYHNDLLGSPVCITDIDGNVAWKGDYLPFGEPLQDIDTVCWGNAYTYLGNEDDGGLMYFHARYYAKELGRFMSCDPIKDMVSSALTINPYVYCGNNPIVFKDPMGLRLAMHAGHHDDDEAGGGGGGGSSGFWEGQGFDTWGGVMLPWAHRYWQRNYDAFQRFQAQINALNSMMGVHEATSTNVSVMTDLGMLAQALSDDDPALIIYSYDTNNDKTELETALTEVRQRYGDKVDAAQVKDWGDFDNLTSQYTGEAIKTGSFDKIVLILHGNKGELGFINKGTKPPSYFTEKINKYYKAKSIAGKELVVWACEQSKSSWVTALGDSSIKVHATEPSRYYTLADPPSKWPLVSDEFGHWGDDTDLRGPAPYRKSARYVLYNYFFKRWFGY